MDFCLHAVYFYNMRSGCFDKCCSAGRRGLWERLRERKSEKRVGRNRGRDRQRYKEKESRRGRDSGVRRDRERQKGSVCALDLSLHMCL